VQASPVLFPPVWTTVAMNTPTTNIWQVIDLTATEVVTQRFYRAFLTPY